MRYLIIFSIFLVGCGKTIVYNGVEMSDKTFRVVKATETINDAITALMDTDDKANSAEGEVADAFARVMLAQQIGPSLQEMVRVVTESSARFWAIFSRDTILGVAGLYYQYKAFDRRSHGVSNVTRIGGGDDSVTNVTLSNSGDGTTGFAGPDQLPSIDAEGRIPSGQMRGIQIGTVGSSTNGLESPTSLFGHAGVNRRSGQLNQGVEKPYSILDNQCQGGPCVADDDRVDAKTGFFQ